MSTEAEPDAALPRVIVPFAEWRLDASRNRVLYTVFAVSVTTSGVKASAAPLVELGEEARPHVARFIRCETLGHECTYEHGGDWPRWLLVVEGDHSKAPFPRKVTDFDQWAPGYLAEHAVKVIGDWRAEAIRDGVDIEPWPGKGAGQPKPSYPGPADNPEFIESPRASDGLGLQDEH